MMGTRERRRTGFKNNEYIKRIYRPALHEKSRPGNLDRFIPCKTRAPLEAVFREKYSAASNSAAAPREPCIHREPPRRVVIS